jgi:hypothetical protein
MGNKNLLILAGVLFLGYLAAFIGAGYYADHLLRARDLEDTLQPVTILLQENEQIVQELRNSGLATSGAVLLDAYLAAIRKDGVPQHSADMKRIATLVNNDTAILALLSRYAPRARTAAFRVAAEKFREYAISFRDRWQSMFEIFMAGGNLPAAGTTLPAEFISALAAERAAME